MMISLKRFFLSTFATLFVISCAAQFVVAQAPQIRLPRPSQKASVMQTIGVTDLTITYSRPGVKGRTIWGDPPASMAARPASANRRSAAGARRPRAGEWNFFIKRLLVPLNRE